MNCSIYLSVVCIIISTFCLAHQQHGVNYDDSDEEHHHHDCGTRRPTTKHNEDSKLAEIAMYGKTAS